MEHRLWTLLEEIRDTCTFVELSHELSPATPHWSGFPDMKDRELFNYKDGFYVNSFEIVSQYGTHVDAPSHFVEGRRMLNEIGAEELILPLCVIDVSQKVKDNVDYGASVEDILEWEEVYGAIPPGAFVALRTDWSKREDLDNYDDKGAKHYPGWSLEALKYLVENRNIRAIGHETSDTDPAVITPIEGFVGEIYILDQDRYQVELMKDLDKMPAAGGIIICAFPRVVNGSGFTARCIGIRP